MIYPFINIYFAIYQSCLNLLNYVEPVFFNGYIAKRNM